VHRPTAHRADDAFALAAGDAVATKVTPAVQVHEVASIVAAHVFVHAVLLRRGLEGRTAAAAVVAAVAAAAATATATAAAAVAASVAAVAVSVTAEA
jgi:hypothetical protein